MITQELLKELLHYSPETGISTWRKRDRRHFKTDRDCNAWNGRLANKQVGAISHGYLRTSIFYKPYLVHRLAFLYVDGSLPPNEVDHINGVTDDNRWANLRAVTHAENQKNQRMPSNNTSGFNGVCWCSIVQKWHAKIQVNSKNKSIGYFTDKNDAISARKSASIKYGYHANHGRTT